VGQSALFWTEFANLSEHPKAMARFEKKFGHFLPWAGLPTTITLTDAAISNTMDFGEGSSIDKGEGASYEVSVGHPLKALRNEVRAIWRADELETKEWLIFCLRGGDPTLTLSFLSRLSPHMMPKPFQTAVLHLLKSASKLRCCHNPDCAAPYFLARRRSQKYCSVDCNLPAQREYKRRWWHKNGDEWRKLRAHRTRHKVKHKTERQKLGQ
jgi:hypothetical protein